MKCADEGLHRTEHSRLGELCGRESVSSCCVAVQDSVRERIGTGSGRMPMAHLV